MARKLVANDFLFLATTPLALGGQALLAKLDLSLAQLSPSLFLIIFQLKHCRPPSVIPEADLEDINTGIEEDLQAVT